MSTIIPVCPNSAYYQRLQGDSPDLTELIDFEFQNGLAYRWTLSNGAITYTLSGNPTQYVPFPGLSPGGMKDSSNLQVAAVNFVMQNSGADFTALLQNDFATAQVKIGRVFVGTPNLGRMEIYRGQVGDFTYDRSQITGQARNIWKSLNVSWPYYSYQDTCAWRFGSFGCGFNVQSVTLTVNTISINSSTTLNLVFPPGTLTNSFVSGRLDFGRATCLTGANSGIVRTIRAQSGDTLLLANAFPYSNFTGMTLAVYPGCRKRLIPDCQSLYNNTQNFMGFPWIILQPLPRFPVKVHGKFPG